jgi:hypothetical protein
MSDLVSKVLAGGLSAAIFLLWWPAHVPADGPEWLAVRGLLWTLAFEILLRSFCPLERAMASTVRSLRAGPGDVAPRPFARALALAVAGLAIPAALVGATGGDLGSAAPAAAAAPKVIVKREIVRREVVVRRVSHVVRLPVAPAPAPTRAATAPSAPARTTRAATKTATATRTAGTDSHVVTAPKRESAATPAPKAKTTTTTAAKPTTSAPAPAATAPAATGAAPAATASSATVTGPVPGN